MQLLPNTDLDIQVARDVLDNDVWQEDGHWWERVYEPLPDGYMSSTRRLLPYSSYHEAALELKEEVYRRTRITLQTHFTDTHALCLEALSLEGRARYRPSKELVARLEQSRWEEIGRWRVSLHDVVYGSYGLKKSAHIYMVIGFDGFIGEGVLYIGQTTVGIKKRLRQHMSQKSPIGLRIEDGLFNRDDLFVEVIEIRTHGYDSLNAAELYFIEKHAPTYNVVGTGKIPL